MDHETKSQVTHEATGDSADTVLVYAPSPTVSLESMTRASLLEMSPALLSCEVGEEVSVGQV